MSRFLLALQACLSQVDGVGTMVFDEIDVGVSGRVTQAIAEKLYQLSLSHQVLCVTHQPIVAAMADAHFHVDKQVIDQPGATDLPLTMCERWCECGSLRKPIAAKNSPKSPEANRIKKRSPLLNRC
jgi:DNA repair ATPase RecN